MSAKVGFTSAGHLGHTRNVDQAQHQHLPTSIPRAGVSVSASASASAPSLTLITNPDTHRQSHSSSKLPSFRFADRRASVSNANGNASGNGIDAGKSRDYAQDDCIIDASRPNNTGKNSPSTSAALSHPSLAYHAPSSPGAPNPGAGGAPASSPIQLSPADPGPVSGPDAGSFAGPARQAGAVTGRTFAVSGSLDLEAPDSVPLPTSPNLAHPTTTHHHHSEKHSSASTPASAPAHASALSPTIQTSTSPLNASSPPRPPSPQRALSFQPESSSSPVVEPPTQARRRTSFPDRLPAQDDAESPHPTTTTIIAHSRSRRSLVSRRSNGAVSSACPPLSLNQDRLQAVEAVAAESTHRTSSDRSSKDSLPGQRELLLPKTLATSSPSDDRRASASHRPPVSYRPPVNHNAQPSTSGPVRVPPIRAFRSSGSRKSLTLDMNSRSRIFDEASDLNDSIDRALRDFEGGSDQDFQPLSATISSRRDTLDGDDTGDVFLKIAREEASKRLPDENIPDETQSVVSRVTRSHRRPLSSVVPTYNPTSPPQIRRRLSDQQETERQRHYDDDRVNTLSRMSTFRTTAREKSLSIHPGEDLISRARAGAATIRAVPSTPRSMAAFQDSDNSTYSRRRGSITDNNSAGQTRVSTYRSTGAGHAQTKTYHSSPLVKSFDLPQSNSESNQAGMEGTESTGSTAPSTVWDELDDLKSRIHRLELTGKLPPTSAAAVSRLSDERPPTATTTVTTMSSSPKRPGNGNANQTTEATSTTSSHREAHPLLQSALAKSKPLLDAEVFRALESAANDAMALSSMMGSPGQPGPISSGASTLGGPGATITDRQLRRKADSVCRSLTELCVALGEDRTITRPQAAQTQTQAQAPAQIQIQTQTQAQPQAQTTAQTLAAPAQPSTEAPTTPTINKTFSGLTQQRRQSTSAEQALASNTTSPRTMSKFEERRFSLLNGSTLGGPRTTASTPSTPLEPISRRRSSLLVSRTRRAGTEEPEDGRRSSLLLRTRRAGTEEPDEGRRTSLLVRNRRKTFDADDDEPPSLRAPSRINTDMNVSRATSQEPSPSTDNTTLGSSALPRRRFTSHLNPSRLVTPLNSSATPQRKYLERSSNQDREGSVERVMEERPQRHMSLGQSVLNRTSSMIRRPNRDSNVTITQSSAAASAYR